MLRAWLIFTHCVCFRGSVRVSSYEASKHIAAQREEKTNIIKLEKQVVFFTSKKWFVGTANSSQPSNGFFFVFCFKSGFAFAISGPRIKLIILFYLLCMFLRGVPLFFSLLLRSCVHFNKVLKSSLNLYIL